MGAEVVLPELHGRGPAGSRGTVDGKSRAVADARMAQMQEALVEAVADACSLLERQVVRHVREQALLAHADVLRMRAVAEAEHPVSHAELRDGGADGLHFAGELDAEDFRLRSPEPEHEAPEERLGGAHVEVGPRDRRGANPHEDFVVLWHRLLDLLDVQHLWRPVSVAHNRFHSFGRHDHYLTTEF